MALSRFDQSPEMQRPDAAVAALALENISEGVLALDSEGKVRYANPASAGLLGTPLDQIVGARSFLYGNLAAPFALLLEEPWGADLPYLTGDGRQVVMRVITKPVTVGSSRMLLAFLSDVTATVSSSKPANLEHQALAHLGEAVLIAEMNGTILYVNPAWERLYGYRETEAVGQNVSILYPKGHDTSHETHDNLASYQLNDFRGEVTRRRKDGTLVGITMLASVVRKLSWEPYAYIVMSHELKKT